jgi:hypothetical protein
LVLPSRANPDTVYINTTLSSHHSYSSSSVWRWTWQRVPKRRQNLIWRRGNTQKKIYKVKFKSLLNYESGSKGNIFSVVMRVQVGCSCVRNLVGARDLSP